MSKSEPVGEQHVYEMEIPENATISVNGYNCFNSDYLGSFGPSPYVSILRNCKLKKTFSEIFDQLADGGDGNFFETTSSTSL